MKIRLIILNFLLIFGNLFPASADPLRVYQIGNSWTCINLGVWDIADSLNSPYTRGFHYAWNQTLVSLWAGAHSASTPAQLQTALTTMQWDIVGLQPWYENYVDATGAATSMANLAFTANPNTKILIFACGPEHSQGPYLTTWNRTDVANFNQANFWKSKLNYELIVNGLRTNFPGKKIGIVPMGHCIAEVARRLQNGEAVPGVTSVDELLEQGGQHTSAKGSYIGQLAAYATFFQQRPHGSTLNNISQCLSSDITVTPEFAAYMWDLVWDVVVNEPYTLVLPEGTDNIGAFNFPGYGTATITGTNLNITVPYGTNVTALAPTFNVSSGATANPPSGTVRNFSTPQQYVVTSAGGMTTKTFTVTVNLAPYEGPRIGVQRAGGTGGSGTQLLADQRAGAPGYKQINWNALASYASNVTALKDSAGNPTTAGFTCDSGGVSSNTGTGATPDEVLFTGSQFRTWGDWTFNITGIPYASYDLVFYVVGPGNRTQGVSLTGGPTYYIRQNFSPTAAGYVDGSALTPFNYLQGTATTSATATVDANYVVFSNLTGANKTVVIPGGFLVTNSFNAFQIVDKSPPPGPQAMITSFDFGALGLATINGTAISLTVPNGTAVTALAPTFTLSAGATCNRVSGAVTDFTTPQSYVVTSSDSLITQTYNVTVTIAPPPEMPRDILTFGLPGNAAVISGTNITLTVPYGTAVTALAPTYTISAGATCVPASGSVQDFTSPVHYVVTSAPPAMTKDYTVTVVVTPASTAKEILTFGPGASVNSGAGTIAWTLPFGTNVTALSPTYTMSALASGSPVSGTTRNFSTPQTYTITAQDGSVKNFVVTATVAPAPTAGAIIGVQRAGGLGGAGSSLSAAMRAGAPGFEQTNWNALGSFASSGSNLKDSTGATTTAAFNSVVGGSAVNNGTPAATSPDEILFSGGQHPTWGDWVFTITGIPYSSYTLVFYEMGPGPRGAQATTLTGGPTYYRSQSVGAATAGYVDGNAATPFTYTRATSTTAGTPSVDANYIVFSGLSGANQTVTIPGGFNVANVFNAFQIVDTSPPPIAVRTPAASGDDAEESPFGTVALDGPTLGIGPNLVGVRFPNLAIPPTAIITSASVQFTAAAVQSGAASFEITAQASGDASAFSTTANDIAGRPITATSVLWQPAAWSTIGQRAAAQRTPDLTALVQSIVSRGDWASGNALVLTLEGTGQRTADAFDKAGGQPAELTVTFVMPSQLSTANFTISSSANDAEESAAGAVSLTSSDLELVNDGALGNQIVGLRFSGIPVPAGAILQSAAVQFAADEVNTEATALTIRAEASDNAAAFTTTASSLSSRTKTTASAAWNPPAWNTIGERAAAQLTPDLTTVLAEVFARPGWTSGNAVALFLTGTGHRTADAFDDTSPLPAQLRLTYTSAPNPGSYLAWISGHTMLTAAQRTLTADPDADGYNNLLEFALAQNPTTPSTAPMSLTALPATLIFTYTRPRVTSGLTYITEWTDDLTAPAWSPAGTTTQIIADNGTQQTIEAHIPIDNSLGRFVRLRVVAE